MSEIGVIELEGGKKLFVEMEPLNEEQSQALPTNRRRPSDLPAGAEPTGVLEDMGDALAQMRDNIEILANRVQEALAESKPSEWSVEINIGFKGKTSPIPFIVEGSADAALKVTATWKK